MRKIAIIGPESTGKSSLAKKLSLHFNDPYIPEYGRTYLEENGANYDANDLLNITKGMITLENQYADKANQYLFCDTDIIMMQVWHEVKFNAPHPWIAEQIEKNTYDFHLLCRPDIPWKADPLRENPNLRDQLFAQYKAYLHHYKFNYAIIEGDNVRLEVAVNALEKQFHDKED